jgi:hypothetical protein
MLWGLHHCSVFACLVQAISASILGDGAPKVGKKLAAVLSTAFGFGDDPKPEHEGMEIHTESHGRNSAVIKVGVRSKRQVPTTHPLR